MPAPAPAKRIPVALWAGIGTIVLAIAGYAVWHFVIQPKPGLPGYAQLTAAPWAEIVSVQSRDGRDMNRKGYTPMQLELPPGEYVIELRKDQTTKKVPAVVESGKITQVDCKVSEVNVSDMVDQLVSKY
jgi:hypothetical protein